MVPWSFSFFFQAEDGIRDRTVTGVQTCALPICTTRLEVPIPPFQPRHRMPVPAPTAPSSTVADARSEERRVGKECRSRWWAVDYKNNVGEMMSVYVVVHICSYFGSHVAVLTTVH